EVKAVNTALLTDQIPCIIISFEKNRRGHIKSLHEQVATMSQTSGVKVILYVEHTVDPHDLTTALWRFCNNLDPRRDSFLVHRADKQTYACMGLDGTRKTKEWDDFHRDWPNIIVADDATIRAVDEKWDQLGIGPLIKSPSLKFKDQVYGDEAVVAG